MNNRESYNKQYQNWTFENQVYTKVSNKEKVVLKELFKKIDLPTGSTILDAGCGLGWKSHILSAMGYKVTGVDISEIAIRKAKQSWSTDKIDFKACDLSRPNILNQQFDIIFASSFSLFKYDFRDRDNKYGELLFSYLKQGGILVFDWGSNSKWKEEHADWAYISFPDAKKYFSQFGEIIGIWASYRELFPVLRSFSLSTPLTYFVILFSHFQNFGYRLYCLVRK